jgi:hypothetical protein
MRSKLNGSFLLEIAETYNHKSFPSPFFETQKIVKGLAVVLLFKCGLIHPMHASANIRLRQCICVIKKSGL